MEISQKDPMKCGPQKNRMFWDTILRFWGGKTNARKPPTSER